MDQPEPFKSYLELEPVSLPEPSPATDYPVTQAVLGSLGDPRPLDLPELARLVIRAAGVRRVWAQPNGRPLYLRTYACAGALYPIEVYLGVAGIDGLEPGLYHYSPLEDALRMIRPGDPRPWLSRAAAGRDSVATAPVTAVLTGIPWRTNWKYQARGYRHLWWDSGMLLANLLGLCASGGHASEVLLGFADEEVDRLVGIDGRREMSLCLVPVGFENGLPPAVEASSPASEIDHPVAPLSHRQRSYAEIEEVQRHSSLRSGAEAAWWQQDPFRTRAPKPQPVCPAGIEGVIHRRGSKRRFTHDSIPREELAGLIEHAAYALDCDWGQGLTQVGVIAHEVDGLEPGCYAAVDGFSPIALGKLREKARFLCLDQALGGDASATLFLMTDLEDAVSYLGERGYRAAQLNAGIVAGRMYLCAYACGFGATGLTFYDDEVRRFFKTEAEPMLVVAVGR